MVESKIPGSTGEAAKKLTVKLWNKGIVEKQTILAGSTNTQYYIRHTGQLMYGKLDFLNCAFGIVPPELDGYESTLDSPAFDIHDISASFLLNKIIQKNFYKKNGDIANGSRKAKRIHPETFYGMEIFVPELPEQLKIADFINVLNKRISVQKDLINALKSYKRGLVNRYFNNGNADFTWTEYTLSEILTERKIYSEKNGTYEHATLSKDGVYGKTERYDRDYLVSNDDKKYKITKKGDICYNPANLKFGVICLNDYGDAIFSPIYVTFEVDAAFNTNFIALCVTRNDFINRALQFQQGTVYERMAVSPEDLLSMKVKLPPLEKQNQFTQIINSFNESMLRHQEILFHLQNLKKGLLQRLFI